MPTESHPKAASGAGCACAPDTLEHLLREFADEWELVAIESTGGARNAFDEAVDKGFRAGVQASARALRALLDKLHDPTSAVTLDGDS